MATLVAFLLSGGAYAARKTVTGSSAGTIFQQGTGATVSGSTLNIFGPVITGEYLPAPTSKALALASELSVSTASIGSLAKNAVKGGLAGVAITGATAALLAGLDWVMGDGAVVKKTDGALAPVDTSGNSVYWHDYWRGVNGATPRDACQAAITDSGYEATIYSVTMTSDTSYTCDLYLNGSEWREITGTKVGATCPSGTTYSGALYGCASASGTAPLTDADFTSLDGFLQTQDGTFQQDLTNQLCNGQESCYQALNPTTQLSGPTTVTGTPTTVTTTSSSGSVSTSTKTPTTTITYGSNYYDYSTTTTTTISNGGDTTTTTDDTDTSLPAVPDLLGAGNDGISGIRDGIPTTTSTVSPLPYMPWYSFSQSCTEVTFTLPYYGPVTTDNCPICQKYIWPTLYFIFAVFTWITCWNIWRSTVLRVRAS